MSNDVYPVLPGLAFPIQRSVLAPPVQIRTTPAQREYRARDAVFPRYQLSLPYDWLSSAASSPHLQTLVGFYALHGGPFDSFLLLDPDDYQATADVIGIGNGTTTAWQLLRHVGAFAEPVYNLVPNTLAPRIADYQGDTPLCAAARTNYCLRSASFGTTWTAQGATVTADTTVAPDGTTTADTIVDDTTTAEHGRRQTVTVDPNQTLIFSIFAKAGTKSIFKLVAQETGFINKVSANFDLAAGTKLSQFTSGVGTIVASSIEAAGNGFYRCSIAVRCATSTDVSLIVDFAMMTSDVGSVSYTGDGTGTVFVWGAMVERASDSGTNEPGRYIPTVGSATTVTDYTLPSWYQSGVITLNAAPVSGAVLTWSGQFYRRCRFLSEKLDLNKFLFNLFEAKKVELITLKEP